ncbi:GroES-like protein, partial [Glonium stellatum]
MSPSNTAAWLLVPEGAFTIKESPYVKPGPGEVVVKTAALAINPADWKVQAWGKKFPYPKSYPAIIGSDIAGEVYEVGEGVTNFKQGDRVIGMPNWSQTHRHQDGAFQAYTTCTQALLSPLPPTIPFTHGCVLPLALNTAAMGLYPSHRLNLPLPNPTP